MRKNSRSNYKIPIICAILSLFGVASIWGFLSFNSSKAVKPSDFNAGRIIDDEIFYNKNAMSLEQIQTWLNQQIGTCDTWGAQPAREWGRSDISRAQFAQQRWGVKPPFVCLNNYHENPETKETSFERGGGAFEGGISAAQIIYDAAQKYEINPQVLLVLLKKESSGPLTNDTWPLKNQYRYAMGYACPDSGPGFSAACSDSKGGFYNQMSLAAWQLDYYRKNHARGGYSLKLGWNDIQYSPNPACGTKRVNIENVATLSLYIYTPYTPNDAALANFPAEAHCGAYGNRNFFMFFGQLFGNPVTKKTAPFEKMFAPRLLKIKYNLHKIDPVTGENIPSQAIQKGQIVNFTSKTNSLKDGKLCLRTEANTATDSNMCVLYEGLEEISTKSEVENNPEDQSSVTKKTAPFEKMFAPRLLEIKYNLHKIDPVTGENIPSQTIQKGQIVSFASKTNSLKDGKLCLRTEANTATDSNMCVLYEGLEEI